MSTVNPDIVPDRAILVAPDERTAVVGPGLGGRDKLHSAEDDANTAHAYVRTLWPLLVVLCMLVGATLRLWAIPHPPPALNVDEAANGEDVNDILNGHLSIFFPRVNGREPLFIYAQALSVAIFGRTPFAMRLPMACFGILTLAATYAVGRQWFGRWIGLLATLSLGTAFWHVVLTRTGLRTGAVPLFAVLCVYALGRSLRTHRPRHAMLAGLWLALGVYTYLSMRLVVVAIALGFLLQLVVCVRRSSRGPWLVLAMGAVTAITTIAVLLPLGLYFMGHSAYLLERVGQVSVFNSDPHILGQKMGLGESLWRTAGGIFVRGDENWKQNLPGRPVFDPLNGAIWVIGLAICVLGLWSRMRKAQADIFIPEIWLLVWPFAVLGGMALAQESPYFPRQSAAIPAVHLLWALGACNAVLWLRKLGMTSARLGVAAIAALLLFQAGKTTYDVFWQWGPAPQLWQAFDGDVFEAASAVAASPYASLDPQRMVIQLDASSGFGFPLPQTERSVLVRQYSDSLPLPSAETGGVIFVYPHLVLSPPFHDLFPKIAPVLQGTKPDGSPAYVVYTLTEAELNDVERPVVTLGAQLDNTVQLVGLIANLPTVAVPAGTTTDINVLWRVEQPGRANFGLYVHLLDSAGHTWAQADDQADVTSGWQAGQFVLADHRLGVPPDAPPGRYRVVAGAGLRTLDEQPSRYVRSLGDEVPLGAIDVGPPTNASPTPQQRNPLNVDVAGYQLLGNGDLPSTVRQGDTIEIPLEWRRLSGSEPIAAALVLLSPTGEAVAQGDRQPPGGSGYPAQAWTNGRLVRDYAKLRVGPAVEAGQYAVAVRIWHGADTAPAVEQRLGDINIQARQRSFTVPFVQHPLDITFGGTIRLLGYDVSSDHVAPGTPITITIYWQDLRTPEQDLTVFVHFLDSTNHIIAQRDAQPQGGSAPTSGWSPGEVLKDPYTVTLPADSNLPQAQVEVGLYSADSGKRQQVTSGGTGDHAILAPLPVAR